MAVATSTQREKAEHAIALDDRSHSMTSDSAFRDLELLAELFRSGGWREMRLQTADMCVLLSTDPAVDGLGGPYSQILLPTAATDARLFVPAHDAAMDAKKRVAPENTDPCT